METNLIKYKVTSQHHVHIDDYEQGEGKNVNNYEVTSDIEATSWQDAIQAHFNRTLHFKFNIDNSYIDEDSNNLQYSNLVDADNAEATEGEFEEWKQGKKTLYVNNTIVTVEQLIEVKLV